MIITYITGAFTLALLALVWSLIQIGFWITIGSIAIILAVLLGAIVALTTWATGRRPAQ